MGSDVPETVEAIVAAHRAGSATPVETVARSYRRIRDHNDPAIFIALRDEDVRLRNEVAQPGRLRLENAVNRESHRIANRCILRLQIY